MNRLEPTKLPDITPADTGLPISNGRPSKGKIWKAIQKFKNGKGAGPDNIPAEVQSRRKHHCGNVVPAVWSDLGRRQHPTRMERRNHNQAAKKGDLSNCSNYRGITLLYVPRKALNRVILEKMKDAVDPQLRDEQARFRRNRSCVDQIATLRIIIEQSLEWNSPLYVNFIDYENAFDRVNRETLCTLLRYYGVPVKIVNLIKNSYEGITYRVMHEGQVSNYFTIKTGVRQGCLLSPFLFLLAIDWIMKTTTEGSRTGIQWTLWSQLDNLDFVDDIALLSYTHHQMQKIVCRQLNTARTPHA